MTIDITHDQLLDFGSAAKLLPSESRPSYTTWWRWCRRGIRGVKLETVLLGGRRFTTADAMKTFVTALTSGGSGHRPTTSEPRLARRSDRGTETELRMLGIL